MICSIMIMQYTEAFYFAGTILEPKNQKWFVSNQYFWLEIRDAHILLFPAVLISQEPWNQRTRFQILSIFELE